MILLTPEGEFVKRPVLGNSVILGQEIHYCETVEVINPPKQKLLTKWRRSGLAVAAVLLMLILTPAMLNMLSVTTETVAYVTIDVNPSIELAIDNKDAVVSAEGLNEEGRRLLERIELLGLKSEAATARIAKEIVALGYIKRGDAATLIITVRPVKSGSQVVLGLKDKLVATTKETLAQNEVKYAVVEIHLIDEELRLSAKQTGVSPGRYLFMLRERQAELYSADGNELAPANKAVSDTNNPLDSEPVSTAEPNAETEGKIVPPPKTAEDSKKAVELAKAPVTPKSTSENNEQNKKDQGKLQEQDEQILLAMLIKQLELEVVDLEKLNELAFLRSLDPEKREEILADKNELLNLLKQLQLEEAKLNNTLTQPE
jgi:hypothetical protein